MNDNFLNSANAPYVAELFFKYRQDPNSVDKSGESFFNSLNEDDISVLGDFGGPEWKERPSSIIDKNYITKFIKSNANYNSEEFRISTLDSIRALRLIRAFRIKGHLIADLDPLGISERENPQELDYRSYGFDESNLE
jgi:2-oxoglutarate dehydrogenase E1 component